MASTRAKDSFESRRATSNLRPSVAAVTPGDGRRRYVNVSVVVLLGALLSEACGGPSAPTGSPSPIYPRGIANSTIFENIPLIRQLEANFARDSSLVFMGGPATQDGKVAPGSLWRYQFGYRADRFRIVQWSVWLDGTIQYDGEVLGLSVTSDRDIGPALVYDSPELARLARAYGAQPYVDRFPMALVGMTYRYRFGTPEGNARFFDDVTTSCRVNIYVNFETGSLLGRDLACLNNLPTMNGSE
jgi:hypothetical protein